MSGQKLIKMDALKAAFVKHGFTSVVTYIQSGNVVFETENTIDITNKIEGLIQSDFGFEVPTLVFSLDAFKSIIGENPYADGEKFDISFVYVTFLSQSPTTMDESIFEGKKLPDESILITDGAVFFYCPSGYGRTKLNNNFIESKLKVKATTRNWKTCLELIKLGV